MVGTHPPPSAEPRVGRADLMRTMESLFRRHFADGEGHPYLRQHAAPRSLENQVRTFEWYAAFLPPAGNVLDWGCNYGPDSCLLRARFGGRYDLSSCDFPQGYEVPAFREFAAADHQPLSEAVALPYATASFDAVIGSGVLEHAAQDYESLKELHRVLKPSGLLVVTYLPNWLSLREWVRRVVQKRDFHKRLYGMGETKQLLKRAGFYPIAGRYHTFFWQRTMEAVGLGRARWPATALTRLLPVHVFSSTLCFVARRMSSM